MAELIQICLAFPAVVFSLLLGLVLIYWACVMVGALDIDVFDLDLDAEGLGGDLDVDVDGDAGEGHGVFADILARLDLTEIPLTVSLSLFTLLAWFVTLVAVQLLGSLATALVPGATIACGAAIVALAATSRSARLLRPLFRTHHAPSNRSLVGNVCQITTLRVDESYGQAEVEDGGAGLLIQVRSQTAEALRRGSRALIYDYDAERGVFHVKPLEAEPSQL